MKPYFIVCLFAFIIFEGDLLAQSGKQQIREAESLREQGAQLYQQGSYQEALPYFKNALAIYEQAHRAESADAQSIAFDIGLCYHGVNEFSSAIKYYNQAH